MHPTPKASEKDDEATPSNSGPAGFFKAFAILAALFSGAMAGCGAGNSSRLDPQLAEFIENRAKQVEVLSAGSEGSVPKVVRDYFIAARKGDFSSASKAYEQFQNVSTNGTTPENIRAGLYRVRQPLVETFGGWELYRDWDPKFLQLFGQKILESIPTNSIYFGGTDAGRFLITILGEGTKKPFFKLTQNQLADGTYLTYLQTLMGKEIYIPSGDDSQKCFQEYLQDVQIRLRHDQDLPNEPRQIKPGEDARIVQNRVQVSGQTAVMNINALLVKIIFDKNPDHEFYIEESFPLDWMFPYLTPHQFIFKLNRKPLPEIPPATVRSDGVFWNGYVKNWLGSGLTSETSVMELVAFVNRVDRGQSLRGFNGDLRFIKDSQARKVFSNLRSASAGLYAWRSENAKDPESKRQMAKEAETAFQQAFAICPCSSESVVRYVNFLMSQERRGDALLLARAASKSMPDDLAMQNLLKELQSSPKPNEPNIKPDQKL